MLKSEFRPSLERIRPVQFFVFKFKALFGSILRATENKLILRKIVKRCPILLISSNLSFLHPYDYFLRVPNSSLGPPKYETRVGPMVL